MPDPTLILHNARITTLDRQNGEASAVAIEGGRFVAVGTGAELARCTADGIRRIASDPQCGQAIRPLASWLSKSSRDWNQPSKRWSCWQARSKMIIGNPGRKLSVA